MLPLDEHVIRASFVNASRKEVADLTLPADFADLRWESLDFLGWRDPKLAKRAYIVVPVDGRLIGVILKRADADPRNRAQCQWCQDVTLPNDVALYSARRAGHSGRSGNTIGTLVCEDFQCSSNARKLPPSAYLGFDREAARDARVRVVQERAAGFAAEVAAE
jgi:hypothetical protein